MTRGPTAFDLRSVQPTTAEIDEHERREFEAVQLMINHAPSAYSADDGSEELADRYNFYVHDKRFLV